MSMINQKQVLSLQQKLSPQQIQMIKLLELPTMQLEQRIKQEIEENIVLEEDDHTPEDEQPQQISVEEYLREDETPSYKSRINNYSKDDKPRQAPLAGGRSLQEYLVEQLGYRNLSEQDMRLAVYLVGSIEEDGYLLVQYAISRHQYRIGYIKADAVSNLSEVAEIGSWANYPAQVLRTSALTDDPLNSCGAVMTLTVGQQVTYLGQLGQEWAFVETTTAQGQRIRGFVELSDLNVTRPDDADDNLNG